MADASFPPAIVDATTAAVARTLTAICGERPVQNQADNQNIGASACLAGIITFVGDASWSLSLILPGDTARRLTRKFAGFDIPLESRDMGDAVGELANVLAGDIVALLDRRKFKAQLSLPTVARGAALELMPATGAGSHRMDFVSNHGAFWIWLMTRAKP